MNKIFVVVVVVVVVVVPVFKSDNIRLAGVSEIADNFCWNILV